MATNPIRAFVTKEEELLLLQDATEEAKRLWAGKEADASLLSFSIFVVRASKPKLWTLTQIECRRRRSWWLQVDSRFRHIIGSFNCSWLFCRSALRFMVFTHKYNTVQIMLSKSFFYSIWNFYYNENKFGLNLNSWALVIFVFQEVSSLGLGFSH